MISNLRTVGEVCLQTVFEEYNKLDCTAKIAADSNPASGDKRFAPRYTSTIVSVPNRAVTARPQT